MGFAPTRCVVEMRVYEDPLSDPKARLASLREIAALRENATLSCSTAEFVLVPQVEDPAWQRWQPSVSGISERSNTKL
jgi:hypothetical protein